MLPQNDHNNYEKGDLYPAQKMAPAVATSSHPFYTDRMIDKTHVFLQLGRSLRREKPYYDENNKLIFLSKNCVNERKYNGSSNRFQLIFSF